LGKLVLSALILNPITHPAGIPGGVLIEKVFKPLPIVGALLEGADPTIDVASIIT
jgi:hypothetical protein